MGSSPKTSLDPDQVQSLARKLKTNIVCRCDDPLFRIFLPWDRLQCKQPLNLTQKWQHIWNMQLQEKGRNYSGRVSTYLLVKEGLLGQDIKLNLVTSMLKRLKAYKMTKTHLEAYHGKTTKWSQKKLPKESE